jgi:hypothetical protein
MNTSVPIAGLPPVLKPIRLKAKFASSLLKFRLHRFLREDFLCYCSLLPVFPFRPEGSGWALRHFDLCTDSSLCSPNDNVQLAGGQEGVWEPLYFWACGFVE